MILQTKVTLQKEAKNPISYASKIVLLGSCFSENIGDQLNYFKFQTVQNPFGILFHPKAIKELVANAIHEKTYTETDLVFQNERWHCFDAHSKLSAPEKKDVLSQLNKAIASTNTALKEATHLVITLGTSWVYRDTATHKIVANCHKIPQKEFSKELLSVQEVTETLSEIITLIQSVNASINIIFTVSPVRHLKDGFVENTQSKSHLIAGIQMLFSNSKSNLHYFPSYEIMMDELRDYRFYSEDLIHPTTTAIQYIWERFTTTWIDEKAAEIMQEINTIQKGLLHRPFDVNSVQHQKFLTNLSSKIAKIATEFPLIKF
ncbi:GSCFA domain-containing protein [Polaribacter sp.]|nr:GSCFA domain-containing protein [Polaribacter sp.]MDA9092852.1 GSCFA domain-containing protein [Polaribacter sp.]MDB4009902.1 GSCFA domain-containing protein [Polaribacter sp.]